MDFLVPTGVHIYIYPDNFTPNQWATVSSYLTAILPLYCEKFWAVDRNANFTIYSEPNAGSGGGWVIHDAKGNIISYSGVITMDPSSIDEGPQSTAGYTLFHELTHLFQGWIPNYTKIVGAHHQAVAEAFSHVAQIQLTNLNYTTAITANQLILPNDYGRGAYLYSPGQEPIIYGTVGLGSGELMIMPLKKLTCIFPLTNGSSGLQGSYPTFVV